MKEKLTTIPYEPSSGSEIGRRVMEITGGMSAQKMGADDFWEDRSCTFMNNQ